MKFMKLHSVRSAKKIVIPYRKIVTALRGIRMIKVETAPLTQQNVITSG